MVEIRDIVSCLLQTGFITLHGGPVQPELLLVKAGWMLRVAKKQAVFDQIDLGRSLRESGMLCKELMREHQEISAARARGHRSVGFYDPLMEESRKSARNDRMVQSAVLIQLVRTSSWCAVASNP